jgi:hypothetical protein
MRFLSPEWLDAAAELAATVPVDGVRPATVLQRVTGGPDGDHTHRIVVDGILSLRPGTGDHADVTLTESWDTAVAINRGTLTPHRAVMSGLVLVEGDLEMISLLAPVFTGIAAALDGLRAGTTF